MKTRIFTYELDLSEARFELLKKLRTLYKDEEMILGVIVSASHDDDAKYMIEFLDTEDGKSEEQVILESLYLDLKREGKMR